MESEIVFAVLGAIVGVTIGQLKSEIIADRFSKPLGKRFRKVIEILNRSKFQDKTFH